MTLLVHLPKFEGPLGLLLHLIRKEEMNILDIDIHVITREYLETLRVMREYDLELAGSFVSMAATLIQIKARMLLPQYNEAGEALESEDPRKQLVDRLLEYQRFQKAGQDLYARPLLNRDVWPRGSLPIRPVVSDIIVDERGLYGLIQSFRKVLSRATKKVHNVLPKTQSISARLLEMASRFVQGARLTFTELLEWGRPTTDYRQRILITFLSLLELGRLGYVRLFQSEAYTEIHLDVLRPIERNVLERVEEFEAHLDVEETGEGELPVQVAAKALRPDNQLALPLNSDQMQAVDESEVATDEELEAAERELVESSERPMEGDVS